MKVKHIYCFCYFGTSEATVRYRATYVLEWLQKEQKISYDIFYPSYKIKNIIWFIWLLLRIRWFRKDNSIIIFQKIFSDRIYARLLFWLLKKQNQHTLYDIDDAEHTRRDAQTIIKFLQNCQACSVGSRALIDYVKNYNQQILFLTSPIIPNFYDKKSKNNKFNIGWIGYYGAHKESLHQLVFPALLRLNFPVKITLLGVQTTAEISEISLFFNKNPLIELELPLNLDWLDEARIYQRIRRFDLGLSPLLDNEFNRAKSAFKLKQCLSCAVPVLASPVGENLHFLQAGENGFFCVEAADFEDKINYFYHLENTEYQQFSQAAVDSYSLFSVELYAQNLLDFYKKK